MGGDGGAGQGGEQVAVGETQVIDETAGVDVANSQAAVERGRACRVGNRACGPPPEPELESSPPSNPGR